LFADLESAEGYAARPWLKPGGEGGGKEKGKGLS